MARWIINCGLLLLILGSLQARLIIPTDEDLVQIETKGYHQLSSAIQPRVDDNSEGNYRLPNTTSPVSYDVELWTNVHTGIREFNGTVKIDLQVTEATNTITLHARQTDNYTAEIVSKDTATATPIALTVTNSSAREFLYFTPTTGSNTFALGTNWTLTINYTGFLRTDQGGFYLSTYTDDAGVVHYLATTQFESTNARHAFPCYDEPNRRANFTITLNHDPGHNAISNMPVDETKSTTGRTVFQTTPRMSTYLIAFIVSDFESTSGELNGLPQRVFSRKGKQNEQEWALWSGLVVENSLAKYFGVPFALPKLDQAGIPDFSAGAMENWGLATYREAYMWWTKEGSTINLKTSISNIIGHEYAHMWFGDLVSVKWWTYLWLKEGFATLFSYESNDIAFPEWNTYQIFHVSDYNSALINDAYATAVPMTHYVQTPTEISGRYNTFSYAKPASVLYMFKNAFTDAVFRNGLNKYLTKHQFNSTDEWDLFASLQESADEAGLRLPTSVNNIFSSWSQKAGYPLLTVQRNYEAGTFTVSQSRFMNDKSLEYDSTWYVPINYATSSNFDFRNTTASHYLLNVKDTTVSDVNIDKEDWLLINKQSTGYYRILYDVDNYGLITKGLLEETHKIHTRNRAQFVLDAYRFVDSGRLDHAILLQLMAYLKNEDQYAPWSFSNSIFTIYDQYLRGDAQYDHFRQFVIEQVEGIFLKLGVNEQPGEHYLNNYLRVILVSLACQVGSEECYKQSHTKLQQWLQQGVVIEPTLRTQAYCAGLRQAEDSTFNTVLADLFASNVAADRTLFISSLGCSTNAAQLKTFVESSIDNSNSLSNAERRSILNAAYSRSEAGLTASLEFLEANWRAYNALATTAVPQPLNTVLSGMATYVVSETQRTRHLNLIEEISTNEPTYVSSTLSTSVNTTTSANFQWLNQHRDPLINWLVSYHSSESDGSASLSASLITLVSAILLLCKFY
ncbi:aminopeptidase N [Drosophila sulfurigaster albostrigata]|uniref:aminopeptidase N n=1 Tax=Drosophila sulfurigaster albostrigata TaxID=89887 RepID=UPI002D21981A|nr:aminopeptidase N [Drosophila sulfurigaster albostrigata]